MDSIKRVAELRDALFSAKGHHDWMRVSCDVEAGEDGQTSTEDEAELARRAALVASIEHEIAALLALPEVAAHEAEQLRVRRAEYRVRNGAKASEVMF